MKGVGLEGIVRFISCEFAVAQYDKTPSANKICTELFFISTLSSILC